MNWHAHHWDNNCEHLVIFTSSRFLIKDKALQSCSTLDRQPQILNLTLSPESTAITAFMNSGVSFWARL